MIDRRAFLRGFAFAVAGISSSACVRIEAFESPVYVYMPLVQAGMSRTYGVGAHKGYDQIGPITKEQGINLVEAEWYYDWSPDPTVFAGIEAVPMIWSDAHIGVPVGGNSSWILGFNEPATPNQANMSPYAGAVGWHQVEQDNPNAKLVSPTTSSESAWWRWDWLSEYEALYNRKPRVDAVGLHIYPRTMEYFEQSVGEAWAFAQEFGVRIWVTEYSYLPCWEGGIEESARMMTDMTQHFIDHPERFERWSPFILSQTGLEWWALEGNTSLVDWNTGLLTLIGEAYTALRPAARGYAKNPAADVNDDGVVDISDIVAVANPDNFGKFVKE